MAVPATCYLVAVLNIEEAHSKEPFVVHIGAYSSPAGQLTLDLSMHFAVDVMQISREDYGHAREAMIHELRHNVGLKWTHRWLDDRLAADVEG